MLFEPVGVSARGITVRGAQGCAFANVSLDVAGGQLALVAGTSGSGRTSLLLALAGRMRLVAGLIAVGDHRLPGDERAVQRTVAVAQAGPAVELDGDLRVADLVRERCWIGGRHASAAAVGNLFDLLGIDPPAEQMVGSLAPGVRTLLAVALAASERPSAVIVDDTDDGCELQERRRVWEALQRLADEDLTVIAGCIEPPDLLGGPAVATWLPHPSDRDPFTAGNAVASSTKE